ncbi:Myb transcription factor [Arachis hypogaea]|uniref:Uncharacterized protein n=1 Tax=Arachis hypogaea TaxID=3818 RepID=A0A445C048_ARAHY|nr:Myb transcription factor [Arachis hypogaea]RYR44373.1 hypothetical protein Ahy_A08g040715 [Arachis hypogaea]
MERGFDRRYIKKGPWSREEDEVLQEHVNKYGARDWSSIRSKGLLPRTGKSCRLRWVNKLRPNLKIGCKFTEEEEKLVIELQGQFGNKWAKIATYLEGRTDNDVKNFWSSRRKRIERMLRKPSITSSKMQNKNKEKVPLSQVQFEEDISCSSNKPEENIPYGNYLPYYTAPYMGNTEEFKMVNLPDLTKPNHQNLESDINTSSQAFEATPLHVVPSFESSTTEYTFPQIPNEPQLEFPVFPEPIDDPYFFDMLEQKSVQNKIGTTVGLDGKPQNESAKCFFEDIPTEIFEYFDHTPTSSDQ